MLQSLELSGFKSFADRTRFDFDPGVTGVVGPNGSGKSNVVDALKWILGVQSAKSLRGKSMADVIFNGSTGRKPSNAAEATLYFDNRRRTLDIDLDEVRVGRRLLRSGESEYLVNDDAVRLKDVVQLFMGTGAGSNAYSIIEQGRVDQILHANATTRRKVFDEAAGISRFRSDRAEAERKLERVEQNLVRLRDIVDEVESRLVSVRSQAEKAARYRELAAELRASWWGLAADDGRAIDRRLRELAEAGDDDGERHEEFEQIHAELESRLEEVDAELHRVDEACRRADRSLARQREGAAAHETTIRHEHDRLVDLDSDVLRLQRQRALLGVREREAVLERDRSERQLEVFEQEFGDLEATIAERTDEIEAAEAEVAAARSEADSRRADLREAQEAVAQLDGDGQAIAAELDGVARERLRAAETIAALDGRRTEYEERLAEAESVIATGASGVAEAETARAEVRARRRAIVEQLDGFQRTIAERRELRSAGEARRAVLEDLESRGEGFGIGVREILDRARTLKDAPWSSVRGSVADLLEVDLEHAAIVDVALSSRAQAIVVDDARPLLAYLQSGSVPVSGRVGLLEYTPPKALLDESVTTDLSGRPGVTARADHLVRSPDTLPGLASQLLADTWIVSTLSVARELAAESGGRLRFVTSTGELLDADGTVHVGTVRSESAVVSRKSELRRLRGELTQLDKIIEAEEQRAGTLGGSLVEIEAELAETDESVRRAVEAQAMQRSDAERVRAEHDRAIAERRAAQSRARDRDENFEELNERLAALRRDRESRATDLDDLRAVLDVAETAISSAESGVRRLERGRDEQRLAVAKQEERLDAMRTSCERLQRDVVQRMEQAAESSRRLGVVSEKRRQAVLRLLNARAELDEFLLERDRIANESLRLNADRDHLRGVRSGVTAESAGLREEQRRCESRRHEIDIELRELRHRRATLAEKIDEEYQTSLEEIIASGASAFETYLASRGGSGEDDSRAVERSPLDDEIAFEGVRDELQARVDRLRRRIKSMGSVGIESLHDLDELETRFNRLSAQLQDLECARDELRDVVRRIDVECKRLFTDAFDTIRGHFRELFRKLFGGGEGDIVLEDPDDPLECGVDIVARPPGKELRNLSLLSGGEKTMTAVALLMSIFKSKPSPFCVLDEVDAALDEANVERYNNVLREFADSTQFIVITHRKPTMTVCDVLYGVTMEQSGVSKRMTVRFEDVNENGEFDVTRRAA